MKDEKDILKWFNNELSDQELSTFKDSYGTDTLAKIEFYAKQLQVPKVDVEKALQDFKAKKTSKSETKVIPLNFKTFLRIASVVMIMIGVGYFAFFNNEKNFEAQYAETETLNLPDDSEVILNADSRLAFNKKTWKDQRDLSLDGEAFFKVSKGQKFTVKTELGDVSVLGTQFNVKERNDFFEVQCFEGLVQVDYNDTSTKLSRGHRLTVSNGTVKITKNLSDTQPSWLSQESSFDVVPFGQVIDELERQYNITIMAKDIDKTQLFTGSFTHKDRNTALKSVTTPLQLSYKIDGDTVTFYKYSLE